MSKAPLNPKPKPKISPIITIGVITFLAIVFIGLSVLAAAVIFLPTFLGGEDTTIFSGLLSPARDIDGTWETLTPVTVYYYSDECGEYERIGSIKMNMTWEIDGSGNQAEITVTQDAADGFVDLGTCDLYAPPIYDSEMYFTGTISSSTLTTYDIYGNQSGYFTFTSNLMEGTLDKKYCGMFFCEGWVTETNELEMMKR